MRAFVLLLAFGAVGPWRAVARADGGLVRFMDRQGPYRLTIFTTPTPLRVGLVDVSVLVQDAATGDPVSDVHVTITAAPVGSPGQRTSREATFAAAANKLFRAAQFDVPKAGTWEVSVTAAGPQATVKARFQVEVAEPSSFGSDLPWWVGWPVIAIALFAVHQFLKRAATIRKRLANAP